ncbi:glycosyltransferase involved in cell wall biosynthesis [Parabacteroides sp. PF5-5]|uniref:glycosyltransferase n=1 Tax=unclassified Parabacteroides TaxID=2649774 RepID=UPI0024735D94|nr:MULTISPECIES: glycosyltransferase [unclassified Parabacteroides]MDH6305552.1 glycosyltransferase involved in cell wall biosynthesis [Parabacteroides sp. PH5-39]MDH6316408.1 glycosyltransferase involved in cell wall biosynthesis [Parabacteroides sp. PF5-13]MDH6319893.1 glycosyltransferase involved in cell wall biosynthesis [Parabacteroides sp. PH5-13]MDH6323516.1 glycosyltransferase involved in cell wall biosynthesis [Parabacteroides sp. PH5-8]MDH6327595.1 glycosyltransferase involved in cel
MIERLLIFSIPELILLVVLFVLFVCQLLYYLVSYSRPYKKAKTADNQISLDSYPPVSVIVYAKNESYNLQKYLPSLLVQDYPWYEVIVINDGSTDESDDVLKRLENEYKHLYHTFIPQESKYLSRRKLSLTIGIKAAKHDILLFTEANCQPLSNEWIKSMVCNYTNQTSIVLGYCAYKENSSFFHKLVGYDNLLSGLQYISSALKNNPFSANGRNLSYKKKLFFEHKGYSHSLSLHAGDDDLFINEASTGENTRVKYTPESMTEMAPFERFAMWKEMKISRAATQHHYQGKQLLFYRMEKVSFFLFLLLVIASVILGILGNPLTALVGVLLYAISLIVKYVVLNKAARMLQQKISAASLPLLEITQPLINLYILIYRVFKGKKDYTFTITGK